MKLSLELPGSVRVVNTTDTKGNPLTVLMVDDMEILYAFGDRPQGIDPDGWEDIFRYRLKRYLAQTFIEQMNDSERETWSTESPTGRETWGHDGSHHEIRLTPEER